MNTTTPLARRGLGPTLVGAGSVVLVAIFASNWDYFKGDGNTERTGTLLRVSRRDLTRANPTISDQDLVKEWTKQRADAFSKMSFQEKYIPFSNVPPKIDIKQIKSTNNYYAPYLAEALEQENKSRTVIVPGIAGGIALSIAGQFLSPRGTWLKFLSVPLAAFLFMPLLFVQRAREDLAMDVLNAYQEEEKKMALRPKLMAEEKDGIARFS